MTVLVTNGTGHLGNNLVRGLLARGERIRVLVRPTSDPIPLEGLDVEQVPGDLGDDDSIRAAVHRCDRVYHVAAFISLRNQDRDRLYDTNVLGTRRVMHACLDAGVRRVVHTSSFGAVGTRTDRPSTEDDLLSPFEPAMDYDRSKVSAETEVLRAAVRGLDASIVNPSGIVGPWDFKPSLMGQTILDFARGHIPAFIPGAFDFVAMRDVVDGHVRAMERGRRGERYLLTGDVVTVDTMMNWLEEITDRRRPRLRIPPEVMLPAARTKDWVEQRFLRGRQPRFNESSIRLLTSGKRGSNERARRELGLEPTPVRDAFAEAVAWFRDRGWLC